MSAAAGYPLVMTQSLPDLALAVPPPRPRPPPPPPPLPPPSPSSPPRVVRSRSSSSISSLGSIHSAPELLVRPTTDPLDSNDCPPPEPDDDDQPRPPVPLVVRHSRSSKERARKTTARTRKREFPSTLWEYFKQEVLTVQVDNAGHGEKSERVTNFLTVPRELEKVILFGLVICLDAFLYTFTILPLRAIAAAALSASRRGGGRGLGVSEKCDLIKMAVVAITVVALHHLTDASKMYHGVRGQETIKLYVLFNVLEIADRLCCSFGQDLADSLFSSSTLSLRSRRAVVRAGFLFALYTGYVVAHALVLFYQLVTLNVAVNSYSNALLTLLLSNQFVEIKGSVFKKFEKETLFQMTCADIVERFQLALMLLIISLRNLVELSSSSSSNSSSTTSTTLTTAVVVKTFSPALTVLASECGVDWLKHSFITKFNHIRPGVYKRYCDVLSKDVVRGGGATTNNPASTFLGGRRARRDDDEEEQEEERVDPAPAGAGAPAPSVARRLGFASLPLACLVIRVVDQAFELVSLRDEYDDDHYYQTGTTVLSGGGRVAETTTTAATWIGRWTAAAAADERGGFLLGGGCVGRRFVDHAKELVSTYAGVTGLALAIWISLITLKLLIGINLRTFAMDRWNSLVAANVLERERERQPPERHQGQGQGRSSSTMIGVSPAEAVEMEQTLGLLRDPKFDQPSKPRGGRKLELEDIGRYDMVRSRLW
ncbi:hypothetical protein JCM11491_004443 [Sporobolomyces phaffii]